MKRLHVHIRVKDVDQSTAFYSTLFGAQPEVRKPDYAKWMLDDPRVNFAISASRGEAGVSHLGIQVDEGAELAAVAGQLKDAGAALVKQEDARCCYARGDKVWVSDPQGVAWETFHTKGAITAFGEDLALRPE